MNWKQAVKKANKIKCRHVLAAAEESTPHLVPQDDAAARVLCLEKIRRGSAEDDCDPKNCPR